jgi:hypothetical protein
MPFTLRWLLALGTILFPFPYLIPLAIAQSLPANSSPADVTGLRLLTAKSGYIFDGTVLTVEPIAGAEPGSVGAVQISFRVEQAIRGVQTGQVLTIREWAGLWDAGDRYRPGERLLLFLYRPSKLGFTSPVGGPLGRFSIDSRGNVIVENARLADLLGVPSSGAQVGRAAIGQDSSAQISQKSNFADRTSQTKVPAQSRVNSRALALAIQRMDSQ